MVEPDVAELAGVAEALALLDAVPVTAAVETVKLAEALGRRLAEKLMADRDYPPFARAMMDGYAIRAADAAAAPRDLRLLPEIAAGYAPTMVVKTGDAAPIMTGAPLPAGADAVVPIEQTEQTGGGVRLRQAARQGQFIAPQGSDAIKGSAVLEAGARLGAAELGAAATIGAVRMIVYARPRAAVLSTGDELVPIESTPGPAQIRNANAVLLGSLLCRLGCTVTDLGTVRDRADETQRALEAALAQDVIFVSGGMSMGAHDYVPAALRALGVQLRLTKLRIKPGKPFVFGTYTPPGAGERMRYMFGLPGNPVSAYLCTLRLAARILARLQGEALAELATARLGAALPANGAREFYLPAKIVHGMATPLAWRSSADLFTLAQADGFIVRSENAPPAAAGDATAVLMMPR